MAVDSDPWIDWARMTDGNPHELKRGTHFFRDWHLVRKTAGMWAFRQGFRCLTEYNADSETLTVRFQPREAGWV